MLADYLDKEVVVYVMHFWSDCVSTRKMLSEKTCLEKNAVNVVEKGISVYTCCIWGTPNQK